MYRTLFFYPIGLLKNYYFVTLNLVQGHIMFLFH